MFERPRHRAIYAALGALDADVFSTHASAFGGGTAIAMLHGEFRESVDIDFIVSNTKGYSALRDLVRRGGFQTLLRADQAAISDFTPFTHDQYGIRGRVRVGSETIKFEIIHEGRFELSPPDKNARLAGVPTLTRHDQAVCKLLANQDRYLDDAVFSRDLLDLAFLDLKKKEFDVALSTAVAATGDTVLRDLSDAINRIKTRAGWLDRCISALSFYPSKAEALQRINHLRNMVTHYN